MEILSESSLLALERGWQRLVSEIGIQFQHEGVLDRFRAAGQRVEDDVVKFDPEWVLEQVRKAPSSFLLRGRGAGTSLQFAPERMAFCACQSAPFVRDAGVRRNASFDDFRNFVRLTQVIDELDTPGYPICEPADLDVETRHLDLQLLHGPGVALRPGDTLVALDGGGVGASRVNEIANAAERFGVAVHRIIERGLSEQLSIFPLTVAVQRIALELAEALGTNPDSFGRDRPGHNEAWGLLEL